jgi:hypothetical protein
MPNAISLPIMLEMLLMTLNNINYVAVHNTHKNLFEKREGKRQIERPSIDEGH